MALASRGSLSLEYLELQGYRDVEDIAKVMKELGSEF